MSSDIVCWKCGEVLQDLILPLSRREECASCGADQHVCRMCDEYDEVVAGQCQEDRAEEVRDKESANFCDYFALRANAYSLREDDTDRLAREKLAVLFGDDLPELSSNKLSEEAKARAELDKLFSKDEDE